MGSDHGHHCTGGCASWPVICIRLPRQEVPLAARVLIAETNAELRERLSIRLRELEIAADCVGTAGEALQKLESNLYRLVIADMGLPSGGIERVIDRIDRVDRPQRPVVMVIAASAENARALDVEIVQIVLRRPVDFAQLVEVVQSCVRVQPRSAEVVARPL